jgi:hypothetical protein
MSLQETSASMLRPCEDGHTLRECLLQDIAFARRPYPIPFLNKVFKIRTVHFFIKDANAHRPEVLDEPQYRGIKESAVQLPPTDETLLRVERVLKEFSTECKVFKHLGSDQTIDDIVVFVIQAPVKSRRR